MKTIISLALILMLSLPIASSIETLICSEKTINCGISCGKCPYSGYDYCQWSWVREGEYSYRGELNPGDPIPTSQDELRFGLCTIHGINIPPVPTPILSDLIAKIQVLFQTLTSWIANLFG